MGMSTISEITKGFPNAYTLLSFIMFSVFLDKR